MRQSQTVRANRGMSLPSQVSNAAAPQDAALPVKSVRPSDTLDLAFGIVADHVFLNFSALLGGDAEFTHLRSGPRLQILLCVWHC